MKLYHKFMFASSAFMLFTTPLSALSEKVSTHNCFLAVNGQTHISGPCTVTETKISADYAPIIIKKGGWFAYLQINPQSPNSAEASWNGAYGMTHAHDELGTLTHKGHCWKNAEASICID